MSNFLKIYKETALPSQLESNAIYLIAPTDKPQYVEMYVTSKTGEAKRHFNEQDAITLINQRLASAGQLVVVDDISKRDELSSKSSGLEVYVKDASGDDTVNSGGARYLWDGENWIKTAETESMDLVLNWDSLQGKPTSTPTQIDQAVQATHTHTNKTQLDKISEDESGNFTYGGKPVTTHWNNAGW